jgi:hypothetical protein
MELRIDVLPTGPLPLYEKSKNDYAVTVNKKNDVKIIWRKIDSDRLKVNMEKISVERMKAITLAIGEAETRSYYQGILVIDPNSNKIGFVSMGNN